MPTISTLAEGSLPVNAVLSAVVKVVLPEAEPPAIPVTIVLLMFGRFVSVPEISAAIAAGVVEQV